MNLSASDFCIHLKSGASLGTEADIWGSPTQFILFSLLLTYQSFFTFAAPMALMMGTSTEEQLYKRKHLPFSEKRRTSITEASPTDDLSNQLHSLRATCRYLSCAWAPVEDLGKDCSAITPSHTFPSK